MQEAPPKASIAAIMETEMAERTQLSGRRCHEIANIDFNCNTVIVLDLLMIAFRLTVFVIRTRFQALHEKVLF